MILGIPQHYSRQIPERCIDLIELLYPNAAQNQSLNEKHHGALSTTLLLALATPAIVLPVERMSLPMASEPFYNRERSLDKKLAKKFDTLLKEQLGNTQFYTGWRFATNVNFFNLSEHMDHNLVARLNDPSAENAARKMPMEQFVRCLRNALSHGGIMYLDEKGFSSEQEAKQLAFISGKRGKTEKFCRGDIDRCLHSAPNIESLNVLRVSEIEFRDFLIEWAKWLNESGISEYT